MKHSTLHPPNNNRSESRYPSQEDYSKKYFKNSFPLKAQITNTSTTPLIINALILEKSVGVIRALNHNLRRRILSHIHSKGNVCVTDIYVTLGLTQSDASQHLRVLRTADVVQTRRAQKQVFYSVNYERLKNIQLHIKNFVE